MTPELLVKFADYGITFFSIIAIIFVVCTYNKTLQNHMSHMTEAIQKLQGSIDVLIRMLGK